MFIPLCVLPHKLKTDWAASCGDVILRRCPVCDCDSIIGHGRRRKQAHDEHHDWIGIRRGRCPGCGKTFTFLPLLSLPYTHYSLLTRCQALRRRFVEHCSWEEATPTLKDPKLYSLVSLKGHRRGARLTRAGLRSLFRHHRKTTNIKLANPHRFRHTFASDMIRAGMSLPALMQLMGHSDIQTTLIYVTVTPQDVYQQYARAVAQHLRPLPVTTS